MGAICGIEQQLEQEVAQNHIQFKLEQLQKIIQSEEKRNFKLIHKLDALCDANGELIAKINTPETCANAAFGGPDGTELLLCASSSVWLLRTKVRGAGDVRM